MTGSERIFWRSSGLDWQSRSELWDFIVAELQQREALCRHRIRPFRTALENQKEDLLAFAAVLDDKLTEISQRFQVPLYLVRQVCLLQGKNPQQTSYWTSWNQLPEPNWLSILPSNRSCRTSDEGNSQSQFSR